MKAVVFHSPKNMQVDNVPDPKIERPEDVILRVTSTAICGSDLHIYNGFLPQARPIVMGHEFMGIVEETGASVTGLKKGDRVVVPFPIACGKCFFCEHLQPGHCENSNDNYGPEGGLLTEKGGALFGYSDLYGGYNGGQAEYVRVPFANFGPRKVPGDLSDEEVLFLTDILPTGYSSLKWADLKGGETVAVFGCGPVGIMAQKLAWVLGAKRVIGVDIEDYRLETARRTANSETINSAKTDVVKAIRDLTDGRGADLCVEAVGMEAHRSVLDKVNNALHMQVGSIKVLENCISAVRRGGTVTVVGVYGAPVSNFPLGQIFDKGIRMQFGQAQAQVYIDELLDMVVERKVRADDIISHRLPITEAPHAYQIFCDKQDDCVKVVLKP